MRTFSLRGYPILLAKELREAWRTSRLPVTLLVFFILGMISPLTAHYTPELLKSLSGSGVQVVAATPTLKDAIAQFVKNVGGNGFLIAIVLAMGSVAREKERGTAAFVLTKPVSRLSFLAATLTAYAYTVYFFGATSLWAFAEMALLIWLALTVFMALTFLASALVHSTVAAASLGFAAWLILTLIGISPQMLPNTPNGLFGPAQALALGATPAHLTQAILAACALIVAALALAYYAFSREEPVATQA